MTPEASEERFWSFRQCPGCGYDVATGEGERGCNWVDCPYLPDELKVRCPRCDYDFATGDGNPGCGYPPKCEFAKAGYRHVRNARRFAARQADRHAS